MTDTVAAPLIGRAVLVTGASSGIGRAIALATARAGADVALTYRRNQGGAQQLEQEIRALGRRAAVIQLDVADDQSLRALGPAARDALGRLDVWVNNAGADILTGAGASLSDVERLDRLLAVDLRGTILASWHAVEILREQREGGVIINMSWDHVLTGNGAGDCGGGRGGDDVGQRSKVKGKVSKIVKPTVLRGQCAESSMYWHWSWVWRPPCHGLRRSSRAA